MKKVTFLPARDACAANALATNVLPVPAQATPPPGVFLECHCSTPFAVLL